MRAASVTLAALLAVAPPLAAAEGDLESCMTAHEEGQKLVLDDRPASAMEEYRVCARAQCPELLRQDCKRRLARATEDAPSLRLGATGVAEAEVRVAIDGGEAQPLADEPVHVDPGSHRVRFIAADGRTVERSVEVRSGERDVRVVAEFTTRAGAADETRALDEATPESAGPSPAVWILGGVAVVGLGGFVAFGLAGKSKQSELDDCKPSCNEGALYDDMHRNYVIADVSLAIGIASAAIATYLYIDAQKTQRVGFAPASRGGVLTWDARF